MWLAVASQDAERAARVVYELWGNGLDADALAAASRTVDLEAANAACPACGADFAPSALRCPTCGLRFG